MTYRSKWSSRQWGCEDCLKSLVYRTGSVKSYTRFSHRVEASLNNTLLSALRESKRCCKSFSSTSPSHTLLLCVTSRKSHFDLAHLRQVDNSRVEYTLFCPSLSSSLGLVLTKPTLILSVYLPLPLVLLALIPASNQIYLLYTGVLV